jgi:transposase
LQRCTGKELLRCSVPQLDGAYFSERQKEALWDRFYDLMEAHQSPVATEVLELIGQLYAIEKEIRCQSPDERRGIPGARARPLLEAMHLWLKTSLSNLSRKSDTAAAIHPALTLWEAMVRYADDDRIEIDNLTAERALRAMAVDRRRYLFVGSDRRGERAAVFYPHVGLAKLRNLDHGAYLSHVLRRIAGHPLSCIEELLPWTLTRSLESGSHLAA